MSKEYKNIEDQIEYIIKEKNIDSDSINLKLFYERSYISIINPYKDFICINKDPNTRIHIYREKTNFNDFKKLIDIDDYISTKLSFLISLFEKRLKQFIAQILSEKMLVDSIHCDNYQQFKKLLKFIPSDKILNDTNTINIKCPHAIYDFIDLDKVLNDTGTVYIQAEKNIVKNRKIAISEILKIGSKNSKSYNLLITHYQQFHKPLPIWTVVHGLNLGQLLTIFNMLNKIDRTKFLDQVIERRSRTIDIAKISKKIEIMREIRNIVNHYEPILPFFNDKLKSNKENEVISTINLLLGNFANSECNTVNIKQFNQSNIWIDTSEYNLKRNLFIQEILALIK